MIFFWTTIFFFKANIFYGRTNKLSFKLCHDYCSECYELGNSINSQKCESCLPDYSYDYWNYFNKTFKSNCVPENYMNDLENNKIEIVNHLFHNIDYNNHDII